jgi:hypothetical protein
MLNAVGNIAYSIYQFGSIEAAFKQKIDMAVFCVFCPLVAKFQRNINIGYILPTKVMQRSRRWEYALCRRRKR